MRELVVIRHSFTKKGPERGRGSHLSRDGVRAARLVGDRLGAFDRAWVSPAPRALETAVAMGAAVDEVVEFACGYVPGEFEHHDQWTWPRPYERFQELLAAGGRLASLANADRDLWLRLAGQLDHGRRGLIVSHGGSIEPVLVAAFPGANVSSWGGPFAHLDAAVLTISDSGFESVTFVRSRERDQEPRDPAYGD
jgi:broad specificity phosphatase PhoE